MYTDKTKYLWLSKLAFFYLLWDLKYKKYKIKFSKGLLFKCVGLEDKLQTYVPYRFDKFAGKHVHELTKDSY